MPTTPALQTQIAAIQARIDALAPDASSEDIVMLAKAVEAVGGQTTVFDVLATAAEQQDQLVATTTTKNAELVAEGDSQVARVTTEGDTQEARITAAYAVVDVSPVTRFELSDELSLTLLSGTREQVEFYADDAAAPLATVQVSLFDPDPAIYPDLNPRRTRYRIRNECLRVLELLDQTGASLGQIQPYAAGLLDRAGGRWALRALLAEPSAPQHHQGSHATGSYYPAQYSAAPQIYIEGPNQHHWQCRKGRVFAAVLDGLGNPVRWVREGLFYHSSSGQYYPGFMHAQMPISSNAIQAVQHPTALSNQSSWQSLTAVTGKYAATFVSTYTAAPTMGYLATVRANGQATGLWAWSQSTYDRAVGFQMGDSDRTLIILANSNGSNLSACLVRHFSGSASTLVATFHANGGFITPLDDDHFAIFQNGVINIYNALSATPTLAVLSWATGDIGTPIRWGVRLLPGVFTCNTGTYLWRAGEQVVQQIGTSGWNTAQHYQFVQVKPGVIYATHPTGTRSSDLLVSLTPSGVVTRAPTMLGVPRGSATELAPFAVAKDAMQLAAAVATTSTSTNYVSMEHCDLNWVDARGRLNRQEIEA